ncbi:hypothetical protein TNCV_1999701 [Trichonephila clavipes]|nr:hypothetical protein TNCV_1999701 [Trichonephila clavipes]
MGDFMYAKNADMHYMYGRANGNGRAALRVYHGQFPDRRKYRITEEFFRGYIKGFQTFLSHRLLTMFFGFG